MADKRYFGRGRGYRGRGSGYRGRGGGGRRGRGRGGRRNYNTSNKNIAHTGEGLKSLLISLDNAGYGAYKQLKSNSWNFSNQFMLYFDRIQSDPFAPASNLRVRLDNKVANIPQSLFDNKIRNIAACDYLTRQFAKVCRKYDYDRRATGPWSAKKGGDLLINAPKQYVLERTSCFINEEFIEVRFECALPGRGRKIEGRWCADVLCSNLPFVISKSLFFKSLNAKEFLTHVNCVEDQEYLRETVLPKLGLVAFISNNAILPRQSGVSDKPMSINEGAIPFIYKKCDKNDLLFVDNIRLKNSKNIALSGLGIPRGITLIIGGGFNGKSTLLNALQFGIYNSIPGDGREYVSCVRNAVKIRSEDGRFINNVNITPFINNLPSNKSCLKFQTLNASGSTSMAANIIENIEVSTNCLLIDEDTCATNFMIRDYLMDSLIHSKDSNINEPITPFISKINALYNTLDISTILVIGGVGQYFSVANHVILMNDYTPINMTQKAKLLISENENKCLFESIATVNNFGNLSQRYLKCNAAFKNSYTDIKIKTDKSQKIIFGNDIIDLGFVSQIVESGQLTAIARAIQYIKEKIVNGENRNKSEWSIAEILNEINKDLNRDCINTKMDVLNRISYARYSNTKSNKLVRPRIVEIAAALNRLQSLKVYSKAIATTEIVECKEENKNNINYQNSANRVYKKVNKTQQ